MTFANRSPARVAFGFGFVCAILAVLFLLLSPASAAPTDLPPRPTPAPTVAPELDSSPSYDASIQLRVASAPTGAWTIVQWQDAAGGWHNVEGWQGMLDEGGQKVWWVARGDMGKGPFRWALYERPGGQALAYSSPFNLPSVSGLTLQVAVSIVP